MKIKRLSFAIGFSLGAASLWSAQAADGTSSNANSSASVTLVSQAVPKPALDGWITLFDGQHQYGCDPTNACFKSGNVFLQTDSLWVDDGNPLAIEVA